MSESRKRSRKSKLEVREDDDFEVLKSETTDTTPTVDPPKIDVSQFCHRVVDHDYCKPGSQQYITSPYNVTLRDLVSSQRSILTVRSRPDLSRTLSVKVEIEVEKLDVTQMDKVFPETTPKEDESNVWRPPNYASEYHDNKKRKKDERSIKMCKYNPDNLYTVSECIAKTSRNPADTIIDIEMRNHWGQVFYIPDEERPHEVMLQKALSAWEDWHLSSKTVRDSPLFYQCLICDVAFWRLQPFREHIKQHNINTLLVTMKEHGHESVIIASNSKHIDALKVIKIRDEACWRCGRNAESHLRIYMCSRCGIDLYTCTMLWEHETKCIYANTINWYDIVERKCTICYRMFATVSDVEKHMTVAHSVRSDIVVSIKTFFRKCPLCGFKYFNLGSHNCTRSTRNTSCENCVRKFSSRHLSLAHSMSSHNYCVECQICGIVIPTKCLVLEHMLLEHTNNYKFAYKCTLCINQFLLYMDQPSLNLHRELWHKKKYDKRRLFYEMMPVPTQCLQENVQDVLQTVLLQQSRSDSKSDNVADVINQTLATNPPKLSPIATEADEIETIVVKQEPADEEEPNYGKILFDMLCMGKESDGKNSIKKGDNKTSKNKGVGKNSGKGTANKRDTINSGDCSKNSEDCIKNRGNCSKNSDDCLKNSDDCLKNSGIISKNSGDCNMGIDKFEANIEIKTEPTDDIEIIEHPVEKIDLVDCVESTSDLGSMRIVMIKSEPKDDDSQDTEPIDDQDMEPLEDVHVNFVEPANHQNVNKPINDKEPTSYIEPTSDKEPTSYIEPTGVGPTSVDQDEVETLTIKLEPGIDMNDIETENIMIKNEQQDFTEKPTESMDVSELVTHLDMFENSKHKEITFEVINSQGKIKKKKVYACNKCGYTNVHKHYKIHVDSFCSLSPGTQKSSFQCTKCNLTFVMFRNYVLHFETHGYDYMCCPVCNVTIDKLPKLLSHVMRHIKSTFVGFQALDKKGREVKSHKMRRVFKCQDCGKIVGHENMFRHWEYHLTLVSHVPPEVPAGSLVKSDPELSVDCERITMNNKSLEPAQLKAALESLQRTAELDRKCVVCYRAFVRRHDTKRHLIEHLLMDTHINKSKNKCFKCQLCSAGFVRQEQYKFHMRGHGCMPIYKCELCNKTFSDSSNFAKHKKTHNIRVLICDLCSKKFHTKISLEKHIIEHETMGKIPCAVCGAGFKTRYALKRHRYQYHEKPRFKCILCDITFDSLQKKWDHNWEVHEERKDKADCPICLKSFRKFYQVKVHARAEHNCDVQAIKKNSVKFFKVRGVSKRETLFVSNDDGEIDSQKLSNKRYSLFTTRCSKKETLIVCQNDDAVVEDEPTQLQIKQERI